MGGTTTAVNASHRVNKIVSAVGRRVDESQPLCDARLLDGSRINIAVRPIAVDGPLVSIRKFSKKPYNLKKLVEVGALRPAMGAIDKALQPGRIRRWVLHSARQRIEVSQNNCQ